jgi:predicted flavoprotein YhiN
MAAIMAGRLLGPGRVALIERSRDGGRKILISGGGRCNVLPSQLDPRLYVTDSSHNTLRKILLSWPLEAQKAFFENDLGIALALEPETGKLFPRSNRARDVRDALVRAAHDAGVVFHFSRSVEGIEPPRTTRRWRVHLDGGETMAASAVLLASGGLSVPATGSDGTGHRILEGLGHRVHALYPALTPLLADPPVHAELAGVSLEVEAEAAGVRGRPGEGRPTARGGFLFTHRGYSGPTVLNMSHFAIRGRDPARAAAAGARDTGAGGAGGAAGHPRVLIRWSGEDTTVWDARLAEGGAQRVDTVLRRHLPHRLVAQLLEEAEVPGERTLAQLRKAERQRLVPLLGAYPLPWTGDEGYRKAEVTGGGVDLAEVNASTLESQLHPGLFLSGEVLDAFGPIGGYNFAWAWATGKLAGEAAARSVLAAGRTTGHGADREASVARGQPGLE